MRLKTLTALWIVAGLCPATIQAQTFTGFPPATVPLTGNEGVPADTGTSPPSELIRTNQLAQFVLGLDPGQNWLIGGDASQNLWQRGTTGPTATTTVVFGPDRWAYWSTSATPMVVSQDQTSTATLPGFGSAFRMQRQAGSTGTDMMCMAQEINSANAVALQGQYVDLDFYVLGGANLSAVGVGIFIVVGTGVNEGVTKLAYGFNRGGGGSVGWTGQQSMVRASYSPLYIGRVTQPAVVAQMTPSETEAAVVICMTPTGTAGTYDFMDFSGIQLRQAPGLESFARVYTAYNAWELPTPPFAWRPSGLEALMQYGYYWQLNEGPGLDVVAAGCTSVTALRADCFMQFPMTMIQVPTMSYHAGFATDANSGGREPCTGLATTPGMVATNRGVTVGCGAGANVKSSDFLYENGGAGMIAADAEFH